MTLHADFSGEVARLVLARTEAANALDGEMISALTKAAEDVRKSQVRAVVLCGSGRHFCAGADLKWMLEADEKSGAKLLANMFYALWRMPVPLISAVHGGCLGGGLGLVAVSDVAIAESSAKFCFSEARLGLIPAIVGPYVFHAAGVRPAAKYFYTAEEFGVVQAKELSLIDEVADDALLRAETVAAQIAQHPPNAVRAAKQLARDLGKRRIGHSTSGWTAKLLDQIRAGEEAQKHIAMFFAKAKNKKAPPTPSAKGKAKNPSKVKKK